MPSTYTPIASTVLNTNTASITFSGISNTYTDLVLIFAGKSSDTTNDYDVLAMRLNSDTGANYSHTALLGDGASAGSERSSNQTRMQIARLSSNKSFAGFDATIIQLQNYSNTTTNKTAISRGNSPQEYYEVTATVGLWRSTSAISAIQIYPVVGASFISGSTATLYGVKAA